MAVHERQDSYQHFEVGISETAQALQSGMPIWTPALPFTLQPWTSLLTSPNPSLFTKKSGEPNAS